MAAWAEQEHQAEPSRNFRHNAIERLGDTISENVHEAAGKNRPLKVEPGGEESVPHSRGTIFLRTYGAEFH